MTMLQGAFYLGKQDLRQALRARETILWVFVMPILFFWFIGTVTSGFAPPRGERKDTLAVSRGENAGFLADELEKRLADQDYRVVHPDSMGAYSRRLTIPAAFTDSVLAGVQRTVRYEYASEGIGGDYERVRVGRATYTLLADYVAARRDTSRAVGPEAFAALAAMPRALTLDVKPAGTRREIPSGYAQAVPGTMIMFLLLVMCTSGAVLLVIERRQGLLRRLASAPIDRGAVVVGKWGGRLALGAVQVAFAMITGSVLFHMDWGANLPWVVLVVMIYAALMAAVGMLLGSLARSEGQAVGIGVVSANVLGALGGCWWPIEIAPAWMQKLALFLPTGWAMDALHRLVAFGAGPAAVLPHVLGMLVATGIVLALAARAFRYE